MYPPKTPMDGIYRVKILAVRQDDVAYYIRYDISVAHVWDGLPICISRPASGLWPGDWVSIGGPLPSGVHWMHSIAATTSGCNHWKNLQDIIYVWSSIAGAMQTI